jgi:hypothetical protein
LGYIERAQTVVETDHFLSRARKVMSDDERAELVATMAADPLAGVLLKGTGGLRKLRFAVGSKGKSGGIRVVYYVYSERAPVFLLEVFAKSERDNLSKADRDYLAKGAARISATYGKG